MLSIIMWLVYCNQRSIQKILLMSCSVQEFIIGQNSCLHAVLDVIDPEKQVKTKSVSIARNQSSDICVDGCVM